MDMILEILTSFNLAIGLFLNFFIIFYLMKKPIATKTSFDLVCIDSILSSLAFNFLIWLVNFLAPLSPFYASIYVGILGFLSNFFTSSVFFAMVLKYLFVFYGGYIFGYSDEFIRFYFLALKMVLAGILTLLDNFGPNQKDPLPFIILTASQKISR